jgi:hypothetical protein
MTSSRLFGRSRRSGLYSRARRLSALVILALIVGWSASSPGARVDAQGPQNVLTDIAPSALAQIDALIQEKEARTPAQQKIDSQLIYGTRMSRGEPIAAGVQALSVDVPRDTDVDASRLVVDVTADVTDALQQQLRGMGVRIVDAHPAYRSLRLAVTFDQLEPIASLPQVIFIQPKQEAMTSRRAAEQEQGTNFTPGQGSKASQGEFTHRAFAARGVFHTAGAGIKIGVISDGVRSLAESQALGDLPAVTVLGNPAPCAPTTTCDEGTAMLEIVHDIAPAAQLYFASGFVSVTDFAQKIRDLQLAGCSIIVDDLGYFVETPFQDGQAVSIVSNTNGGVVSQAVKDVAALGVLYFSSASNSGNLNDGTSGTWEGDFADGGAAGHAALVRPAGCLVERLRHVQAEQHRNDPAGRLDQSAERDAGSVRADHGDRRSRGAAHRRGQEQCGGRQVPARLHQSRPSLD